MVGSIDSRRLLAPSFSARLAKLMTVLELKNDAGAEPIKVKNLLRHKIVMNWVRGSSPEIPPLIYTIMVLASS